MNAMNIAYRDSLEGARLRYADLLTRAGEGLTPSAASRVYAARTGRVWAGVAGIAGAAGVVTMTALRFLGPHTRGVSPTLVLLLSWPAMVSAYIAGALGAAHRAKRALVPAETGDLHADLARLEQGWSVEEVRALANRWPWASTALPMMAVAFLAPLSLHAIAATFMGALDKFDEWIALSIGIVGHAHVALAIFYAAFGSRARWLDDATLAAQPSPGPWAVYGWVVLVSAIPGILFMLLPPIITAVTALFFHPFLYRGMIRTLLKERAALA
jgi:hypothetical protein